MRGSSSRSEDRETILHTAKVEKMKRARQRLEQDSSARLQRAARKALDKAKFRAKLRMVYDSLMREIQEGAGPGMEAIAGSVKMMALVKGATQLGWIWRMSPASTIAPSANASTGGKVTAFSGDSTLVHRALLRHCLINEDKARMNQWFYVMMQLMSSRSEISHAGAEFDGVRQRILQLLACLAIELMEDGIKAESRPKAPTKWSNSEPSYCMAPEFYAEFLRILIDPTRFPVWKSFPSDEINATFPALHTSGAWCSCSDYFFSINAGLRSAMRLYDSKAMQTDGDSRLDVDLCVSVLLKAALYVLDEHEESSYEGLPMDTGSTVNTRDSHVKNCSFVFRVLSVPCLVERLPASSAQLLRNPKLFKQLISSMSYVIQFETDIFRNLVHSVSLEDVVQILSNILDVHTSIPADQIVISDFVTTLCSLLSCLPKEVITKDLDSKDHGHETRAISSMADEGSKKKYGTVEFSTANSDASFDVECLIDRLKPLLAEHAVQSLLDHVLPVEDSNKISDPRALASVCSFLLLVSQYRPELEHMLLNTVAFSHSRRHTKHLVNRLWYACGHSRDKAGLISGSEHLLSESPPSLGVRLPIFELFAKSFSHQLYVSSSMEMLCFDLEELRALSKALKELVFESIWIPPTIGFGAMRDPLIIFHGKVATRNLAARLLSRLHMLDTRKRFSSDETFWVAGKGALMSTSFASDCFAAGREGYLDPNHPTTLAAMANEAMNHPTIGGFGNIGMGSGMLGGLFSNSSTALSSSPFSSSIISSKTGSNPVLAAAELLKRCPFMIPFSVRAKVFSQWVAEERNLVNQDFFAGGGVWVTVRREFIYEDAYAALNGLREQLKKRVKVKFIDVHGMEEAGIDGGGVFKEFLHEFMSRAFSPALYGLFKANTQGRLYPNPYSGVITSTDLSQFEFLGRMLGKALFDGVLVDLPFANFFLNKLLGGHNSFEDLNSLDPDLFKNLLYLKECEPAEVRNLDINFTVVENEFGEGKELELIPNGRNIPVDASNRIEYLHRVANYKLNTQIQKQCGAFLRGFSDVMRIEQIRIFDEVELQRLISGQENAGKVDIVDWKRHTHYSGGYTESSAVIQFFWRAVTEMTAEEQAKLLQFITSSPRAPLLGFRYLDPGFSIHRADAEGGDARLPTASTCMNLLKLPEYKTYEQTKAKLAYALEAHSGFDLS